MEQFPYRVLVEFSAEDEAYIARVPAFEGLAAHGESPEEATHQARIAAEAMLASLRSHHRAIPQPDSAADYSGQLRLRLPRSVHARLSKLAAAEEVSLNNLLLAFITEGLGRRQSGAPAMDPALPPGGRRLRR
jgi:antitoxin HicB